MNYIIYSNDNNEINAAYNQLKKSYPNVKIAKTNLDIDELIEDEYLLVLAEERLKSDRPTVSRQQMRKKYGITQKDIDEAEADFD